MRGTIALSALAGLFCLSGCITSSPDTPEWFAERSAENDSSYPSLRSVPRETIANTNANYWQRVDRELIAAGEALKNDPRAAPASAADAINPDEFLEEAREDLEETRQSHGP